MLVDGNFVTLTAVCYPEEGRPEASAEAELVGAVDPLSPSLHFELHVTSKAREPDVKSHAQP